MEKAHVPHHSRYQDTKHMYANRGFALVFLLIPILLLVIAGIILWHPTKNQDNPPSSEQNTFLQSLIPSNESAKKTRVTQAEMPILWGGPQDDCEEKESFQFTTSPISTGDITVIEPMGELKQGHIIPGDHIGINYKTSPTSTPVNVYTPADGIIVMVEHHPYTAPPGYPQNLRNYHIYITHSCTFFGGYLHITDLSKEILAKSSKLQGLYDENPDKPTNIWPNIRVKAGEKIGTAWSMGLLGMVAVDLTHTNTGYLNPESYSGENWRLHAVSPWLYFKEPLKSQWYAKNPRITEPRGGKIDFDIEGKLVGNWFEEGTNGMKGDSESKPRQCGNWPCPYWEGHIAFVYDYIDPTELRVSIGYQTGFATQTPYGVMGNSPDFKDINPGDGMVKYELVSLRDVSAERGYETDDPLIEVSDENNPLGIILIQLTDKDTLKAEIFPGRTPDQVSGFSNNARVYVR